MLRATGQQKTVESSLPQSLSGKKSGDFSLLSCPPARNWPDFFLESAGIPRGIVCKPLKLLGSFPDRLSNMIMAGVKACAGKLRLDPSDAVVQIFSDMIEASSQFSGYEIVEDD